MSQPNFQKPIRQRYHLQQLTCDQLARDGRKYQDYPPFHRHVLQRLLRRQQLDREMSNLDKSPCTFIEWPSLRYLWLITKPRDFHGLHYQFYWRISKGRKLVIIVIKKCWFNQTHLDGYFFYTKLLLNQYDLTTTITTTTTKNNIKQ